MVINIENYKETNTEKKNYGVLRFKYIHLPHTPLSSQGSGIITKGEMERLYKVKVRNNYSETLFSGYDKFLTLMTLCDGD